MRSRLYFGIANGHGLGEVHLVIGGVDARQLAPSRALERYIRLVNAAET